MMKNFPSTCLPGSFIKSEPQSTCVGNSLDFETEQDSSLRTSGTAPIKSLEFLPMNDTLEHLRALCLQQAASDVQRACRQLCISSNPFNWNAIDVQNWLQWLCNERKIDSCWKSLDFLMKSTGSELVGFCEKPQTWINLMELQSVHLLVMDKIVANLEIWRLVIQSPQFQQRASQITRSVFMDDECSMSSEMAYPTYSRSPSAASSAEDSDEESPKSRSKSPGQHIHLWQFLRQLLASPQHRNCIRWVDRKRNIFKIENSVRVSRLWGQRKNRPAMNYDKLSRSIRQYYKKGIMKKTERAQRLVYQFCGPFGFEYDENSHMNPTPCPVRPGDE